MPRQKRWTLGVWRLPSSGTLVWWSKACAVHGRRCRLGRLYTVGPVFPQRLYYRRGDLAERRRAEASARRKRLPKCWPVIAQLITSPRQVAAWSGAAFGGA